MAVKLRGDEGYYAAVETIDGTKFFVADLADEQFDEFLDKAKELQDAAGLGDLAQQALEPEAMVARLTQLQMDIGLAKSMRASIGELIDWLLECGLADWNLSGVECTSEARKLLPSRVKSQLAAAIVRESQLSVGEANFLGLPQRRPAEG